MTVQDFCALDKAKQVEIIKSRGSYLFIRNEAGVDIILYQIDGFYAEVYFGVKNMAETGIRCFDDTNDLDLYLQQINISELQELL